jgi:hypothetical protein
MTAQEVSKKWQNLAGQDWSEDELAVRAARGRGQD